MTKPIIKSTIAETAPENPDSDAVIRKCIAISFTTVVLNILSDDTSWNFDTVARIANLAVAINLATCVDGSLVPAADWSMIKLDAIKGLSNEFSTHMD